MIKNGKYFLPPPADVSDFKELFRRIARSGAGRPVDKGGLPTGPWTPELLADAIARIEGNENGIELRTVQRWFQDNSQGINSENILWLAAIAGCGDADARMKWQIALAASQARLVAKRREMRNSEAAPDSVAPSTLATAIYANQSQVRRERRSLAITAEAMFAGRSYLNLPIVVWSSLSVLWFSSYILGVHNITYSPKPNLTKQVGFFWSPSWNVGEMIFLPMFLIVVSSVLHFWKEEGRLGLSFGKPKVGDGAAWSRKVESFTASYWAILFISFVLIFLVQWSGVYLLELTQDDANIAMVDWILVAKVRPDVVPIADAIAVSFLAFLYSGIIYWLFFNGLLIIYTLANDFAEICGANRVGLTKDPQHEVFRIGLNIMRGVFSCSIFGCFIAICIKLNATYLISDAESIGGWLIDDALAFFGVGHHDWDWIDQSPSPFFTSFLLLFIVCAVFTASLSHVALAVDRSGLEGSLRLRARVVWWKMIAVIILLTLTYLFIGEFSGFSVLLAASLLVAAGSLIWSMQLSENRATRSDDEKGRVLS